MERRDEPVEAKVCSRCNLHKHNSDFYRDSSKPDGLQVNPFCTPPLLIDHAHTSYGGLLRGMLGTL